MLEKKGSQYKIRVQSPGKFNKSTIRTKDVGKKGGLQIITGRLKGKKKTSTQALRFSTKDFKKIKYNRGYKLVPITKKGLKELESLKKRNTGKLANVVDKYFFPSIHLRSRVSSRHKKRKKKMG